MGGSGSGGWNRSRRGVVERGVRLGLPALRKHGALKPGASTIWRWERGGESAASIAVDAASDCVRLNYSAARERIEERIGFRRTPCHFGGWRLSFICPRCLGPALYLHLSVARFMCRGCARLSYASQRERARDRHLRAANKLRLRLGGDLGAASLLAPRPKGMWAHTYAAIREEIERREALALEELAGWMMRFRAKRVRTAPGFWS